MRKRFPYPHSLFVLLAEVTKPKPAPEPQVFEVVDVVIPVTLDSGEVIEVLPKFSSPDDSSSKGTPTVTSVVRPSQK